MMVTNIIPGVPPELRIIGPVVMGVPLAIAVSRLLKKKRIQQQHILDKLRNNRSSYVLCYMWVDMASSLEKNCFICSP
ncbi:MAG: hypothetical protein M3M91_01090 [Thermoproteota archaeon]|nr:hypothetical protein [Thermoproteota archaeon]